jgi:hypothetical protein
MDAADGHSQPATELRKDSRGKMRGAAATRPSAPASVNGHYREGDVDEALKESDGAAQQMIEELLWWTEALKKAREAA